MTKYRLQTEQSPPFKPSGGAFYSVFCDVSVVMSYDARSDALQGYRSCLIWPIPICYGINGDNHDTNKRYSLQCYLPFYKQESCDELLSCCGSHKSDKYDKMPQERGFSTHSLPSLSSMSAMITSPIFAIHSKQALNSCLT